jgi:hypothetical protein
MQRTCYICGTINVEYNMVEEYPIQMIVRAKQLGLTPEEHAAKNLPHVSYKVVNFVSHQGSCGLTCAGSYTQGQRIFVSQHLHDGTNCPCIDIKPGPCTDCQQDK